MMNNLTIPAYSEQAAQAVKERLDSAVPELGKQETRHPPCRDNRADMPSFPKIVVLFAADRHALKGVSATGRSDRNSGRNFAKAEVRSTPSAAMLGLA
ncbi:MAG: hypothetical protein ACLSAH_18635 [Bilophila wadsworthia]